MIFQENFNDVCRFHTYHATCFDKVIGTECKVKNFYEKCELFKKEHGLENLYFSKLVYIEANDYMMFDVWYEVSDLYLTYLEANNSLPEGVTVDRYIIKEEYLYNSQKYNLFQSATISAMRQQVEPEIVGGHKLYKSSAYLGLTEKIKLSSHSNGLPSMIVERIPMTYDDLIDKKF